MKSLAAHVLSAELDVTGVNLVEASAGTGKTYSIETLFLRMVVAEGIPVQELLVVTFTDAATKELRERLRSILEEAYGQASGVRVGADGDKRIPELLALPVKQWGGGDAEAPELDDATLRCRRLRRALLDFDQAAISTIHGFCQRALQEFAFETGHDFDAEVISGDSILRELCADWWRRVQYGTPTSMAQIAERAHFPALDTLVGLVQTVFKRPAASLLPTWSRDAQEGKAAALTEQLAETLATFDTLKGAVLADINDPQSEPFFSGAERKRVVVLIDLLTDPSETLEDYDAFSRLEELARLLAPKSIANPLEIPPAIDACIKACLLVKTLAENKANKVDGKGGAWVAGTGTLPAEWDAAVTKARDTVLEHAEALRTFFSQSGIEHSFTKTDLVTETLREKRLAAIDEAKPGRDYLTALKRVATVKKRNQLAWSCSAETSRVRPLAGEVAKASLSLHRLVLVKRVDDLRGDYDRAKREAHGMTYDDMLLRLQGALESEERGARLRELLRNKYRVALIDEFQDTDPVQYAIFRSFMVDAADGDDEPVDAARSLFYVGDPKQAIYSFRGGDIFTYRDAARAVESEKRYSLDTNYRSQERLIDAINEVFRNRDEKSRFGSDDIQYSGELGCQGLERRMVQGGGFDDKPFKVWAYQGKEGGRAPTSYTSLQARMIYQHVANEIAGLLSDETAGFAAARSDGQPEPAAFVRLRASDIVVLVRRHAEAAFIYRALRARGVPAVRQAGDNVFDSIEAGALSYLLQAMIDPGNLRAVKTALASGLLPVTDEEIRLMAEEKACPCRWVAGADSLELPDTMDGWMAVFKQSADTWRRKSFSVAFAEIVNRSGMTAWLADQSNGERRYTNVMQVHDLIHRVAGDRNLGPDALLSWLLRQLDGATREKSDAFETRLESDADAVQIMTVFKSKGLEFPVVFVPTMWGNPLSGGKSSCSVYHEEPTGGEEPGVAVGDAVGPSGSTIVDLEKGGDAQEKQERKEEDIRNLYVALTRASQRTYVVAGELGPAAAPTNVCLPPELLEEWAEDASGPIAVIERPFMRESMTTWSAERDGLARELHTAGEAKVDKSRGHASFSAIAPQGHGPGNGNEAYDFDAVDIAVDDGGDKDGELGGILSFPAGARTGECWHRIFELLDFGASRRTIEAVVNEQLALFRFDRGDDAEARREETAVMVETVLRQVIEVEGGSFPLNSVTPARKLAELAFDFSLQGGGGDAMAADERGKQRNAIWHVLNAAWKDAANGSDEARFLSRLENWEAAIPGGFMTGFVDLFFEHDGKYYILDWKSNWLDGKPRNFDRPGMVDAMADHAYFLQYLLYTVAVDNYLRACLGDAYNYDEHFGGAIYVFLRGVGLPGSNPHPQRGIYYYKPEKGLVEALSTALLAAPREGQA